LVRQIRAAVPLLLSTGLSVRDFYEITKRQVLVESLAMASHKNGKPNQSLVSAMTGLTRPEIRSLMREQGFRAETLVLISSSRSIRVAREWLRLEKGTSKRLLLPMRGKQISFQHLVRKLAGDVPVIAMQKEMLRLGWVRLHPATNQIELLRKKVLANFSSLI
jgi:hypothetical protein